jgi:hypothetical protein
MLRIIKWGNCKTIGSNFSKATENIVLKMDQTNIERSNKLGEMESLSADRQRTIIRGFKPC